MSIIAAGTTTTTALSSTGNTDGTLQLQVNGTTPSVTLNTLGAIGVGSTPGYGTSGQVLTSGGSTVAPTWATPTVTSPAGSTGQVQYNNAGAFGAVSSGTSGQVLTSAGSGAAPTWADLSVPGVGATQVGSLIISQNQASIGYAANPANQILRTGWTYLPEQFYSNGGAITRSYLGQYVPKYSTYYGGWLAVGSANNDLNPDPASFIMLSTNGNDWMPLIQMFSASTNPGYSVAQPDDKTHALAVDESNGRIFVLWQDTAAYTNGFAYQTTAASPTSTWTVSSSLLSGASYSQQPQFGSIEYVNMGSTATSGVVITGKAYSTGLRVFVIPAGSTTSTTRYSGSYPSSNNYGSRLVWNASAQKAMVVTANGGAAYNQVVAVASDVNQSWTLQTALTVAAATNQLYGLTAMSASYNVYASSATNLYYSTTYSGWTSTAPGIGTMYSLTHNGTNWVALTSNGLYYSSNATPTGFTAVGIRPQNQAQNRPFGQRRI